MGTLNYPRKRTSYSATIERQLNVSLKYTKRTRNMTAKEKIAKAENIVANHHDFFAPAIAALPKKFIDDDPCLTACTNGETVKYGTQYVDTLNVQQAVGLIVHEILHPLLDHILRLATQFEMHPQIANIGADYEIINYIEI